MKWDEVTDLIYWTGRRLRRLKIWLLNPSQLLRGMLFGLFILFVLFIAIQKNWWDWFSHPFFDQIRVDKIDWIPTVGVYLAASGWIINAIVTMRNSVKQHTINTLLQSRLSATYMEQAPKAQAALSTYTPQSPAPVSAIKAHPDKSSVDYLLNYLEFVSVGIRHGDLHEQVMRDTMRGIVTRLIQINQEYIKDSRTARRSHTFENLIWLYKRWRNNQDQKIKW